MDVIVVGGGLFGSIASALAEKRGATVTVLDSEEQYAASLASACLFRLSWLSKLGREKVVKGYEVLESLFGVKKVTFKGIKNIELDWVSPDRILSVRKRISKVVKIGDGYAVTDGGKVFEGKILVATGAFTPLVPTPRITPKAGVSFKMEGQVIPQFRLWAPYRQAMMFNLDSKRVWVGDGSSILKKNWSQKKAEESESRVRKFFGIEGELIPTVGIRPYIPEHPQGFFKKVYKRTWVSNGGAKNGTILAAYQAWRFCEEAL